MTEDRAKAAKVVCESLLEHMEIDEAINVLMTAWGVLCDMEGNHTKVRCMQIRAMADHLQARAAMRGKA